MQLTLKYAVQSQAGVRPNNEDAAFAGPRLLALTDGMGGHAGGEVAASLALAELISLNQVEDEGDVLEALRDTVDRANDSIAERARLEPELTGMGTTLTALRFTERGFGLVHVGDSRAYRLRDGELQQITRDDSLVQSLVDQGRLTLEEAARHPRRAVILKVLSGMRVEPYLELLEAVPGDRYLICSDGLPDYVPANLIAEGLGLRDIQRCPQELIRQALLHGSQDNITCVVGEVTEGSSGYDIELTVGAPEEAELRRSS